MTITKVFIVIHEVEWEFSEIVDVYFDRKKADTRVVEEKRKHKITKQSNG